MYMYLYLQYPLMDNDHQLSLYARLKDLNDPHIVPQLWLLEYDDKIQVCSLFCQGMVWRISWRNVLFSVLFSNKVEFKHCNRCRIFSYVEEIHERRLVVQTRSLFVSDIMYITDFVELTTLKVFIRLKIQTKTSMRLAYLWVFIFCFQRFWQGDFVGMLCGRLVYSFTNIFRLSNSSAKDKYLLLYTAYFIGLLC
jgi:hypothetical protein